MMDNGDDRIFAGNIACGTAGNPPCLYSTVPVYQIDETAMTATLVSAPNSYPPPNTASSVAA